MNQKSEFKEDFLHFIWQNGYFDIDKIKFKNVSQILIKNRGFRNTNQGPDFLNAHIEIEGVNLYGSIEIHKLSSEWTIHKHQHDINYENVILHVVYEFDIEAVTKNNFLIPTLILKDAIDITLIDKYRALVKSKGFINCENHIHKVENIYKSWAVDKALVQRLERKSSEVLNKYDQNNINWQSLFHHETFIGFGQNLNGQNFEILSRIIDYKIIQKLGNNMFQIESILFGAAGFLEGDSAIDYQINLKKEYQYLKNKFQINNQMDKQGWNFLRMRPHSFPTLRIAQLASFLANNSDLNSKILALKVPFDISDFEVSSFWKSHFLFSNSASSFHEISKESVNLLINNILIRTLGAYALYNKNEYIKEKLIEILTVNKAESNNIVTQMKRMKFPINTFADSQGALELYSQYCKSQKCLDCVIGNYIIKN